MTAILDVEGLTKRFGGVTAVDGCSFCVAEGSITGLIGPNGAGKTTVFNLITGLLTADAGRIVFDGRRVARPEPTALYRRGLTRTFQQPRVFRELTLVENLSAAGRRSRWAVFGLGTGASDRELIEGLLGQFGLRELAGSRAAELSFGQQKLLEFATVLMSRPKLVLLDEPTAGVSPRMTETVERHIRALNARGISFLIVEHEMSLVMRLCDPIVVLDHGTKVAEGTPAGIRHDPAVLEAYLGTTTAGGF